MGKEVLYRRLPVGVADNLLESGVTERYGRASVAQEKKQRKELSRGSATEARRYWGGRTADFQSVSRTTCWKQTQ